MRAFKYGQYDKCYYLMPQLMPGLLYVFIVTAVFTVLLISATAVLLLSSARAIVRRRYISSIFGEKNVAKASKSRPILAKPVGLLLSIEDAETNRLLTTFKRPAELRLYQDFFYARPYFSRSAYLIQIEAIHEISITGNVLVLALEYQGRRIIVKCWARNLANWRNRLERLISEHK